MSGTLRLTKIKFRVGSKPDKEVLEIEPSAVTILVGPNNSGKSYALFEIDGTCRGNQHRSYNVIDSVEVDFPNDPNAAEEIIQSIAAPAKSIDPPDELRIASISFDQSSEIGRMQPGFGVTYQSFSLTQLRTAILNKDHNTLFSLLSAHFTALLSSANRLSLARPQPVADLREAAMNHLGALFKDDEARKRLSDITRKAFRFYFVIDPTGIHYFQVRMSQRRPQDSSEEQGLHLAARNFHDQARPLSEFGEGIQAFVGLLAGVLSRLYKIILIDEPETFLHPPMARLLGRELTKIASERKDVSLVMSTHSSDFLMGCLEYAPEKTTIVRLTYDLTTKVATARKLSSNDLTKIMRNPLLRSTELLKALFHQAAIVVEGNSDRVVYDEINQRLRAFSDSRGIADALFLSTQEGISTVHEMVGILRRIGIPAVAIVDLDVFYEDKDLSNPNWKKLLGSCQIPSFKVDQLEPKRKYLIEQYRAIFSTDKEIRKNIKIAGLNVLSPSDRLCGESFIKELSDYGLFLVPVGELESWLSYLGVKRQKSDWINRLFEKVNQLEIEGNQLVPRDDDIWEFLDEIAVWINHPNRLGLDY